MAANTIIHSVDTTKSECVVSVYDDGVLIYDRINVGVDLSADTSIFVDRISEMIRIYRNDNFKI